MVKHSNYFEAEKGKHFVLTERGKEWASYKNYNVGEPIEEDDRWILAILVEKGVVIEVDDPDWVTLPGFQVVYDYNGRQISCGNSYIFPDRETAERYKKHHEELHKRWGDDKEPYIIDAIYEGKKLKENKIYNGKTLFVKGNWFGDMGRIGDLVEDEVAQDIANYVPPAYYSSSFIQCGEPISHTEKGATYMTFVRIDKDVWEYKGNCLRGKTEA